MKIISQMPNGKVLVTLSRNEISILTDHTTMGAYDFDKLINETITKEQEIDISQLYTKFDATHSFLRSNEVDRIRRSMTHMLKILGPIQDSLVTLDEVLTIK